MHTPLARPSFRLLPHHAKGFWKRKFYSGSVSNVAHPHHVGEILKAQQQPILLDFCLSRTRAGKYHHDDYGKLYTKKNNQAWTGLKSMTSAIPVQCCTVWAIKPTERWSPFEFVKYRWIVIDQSYLHIFLRSSNIWSFICSFQYVWFLIVEDEKHL